MFDIMQTLNSTLVKLALVFNMNMSRNIKQQKVNEEKPVSNGTEAVLEVFLYPSTQQFNTTAEVKH